MQPTLTVPCSEQEMLFCVPVRCMGNFQEGGDRLMEKVKGAQNYMSETLEALYVVLLINDDLMLVPMSSHLPASYSH
jgi:hypothetical protein